MYTCYIALNKTLYRADEGLDIRPNLGNSKKCDCAVQVCIINVIINSFVESFWNIYMYTHTHTGCPGGDVPDFGKMFLTLKYTDITQNTISEVERLRR